MTDASLSAKVTADIADFTNKFDDMRTAIDNLAGNTGSVEKATGSASGGVSKLQAGLVVAATAAAAATTVIVGLTRAAGDHAEQLLEMADKTGMTAERLQQLEPLLNRHKKSFEDLQQPIQALAKNYEAAIAGSDKAVEKFAAFGIAAEELKSLQDPAELLARIADTVSTMPPGLERVAALTALLGKTGQAWIPVLAEGAEGFRRSAEQATAFGNVLASGQLQQLAQLDDAFDDLGLALGAFKNELGATFAPAVLASVKGLTFALQTTRTATNAMIHQFGEWKDSILGIVKLLVDQIYDNLVGKFVRIVEGVRARVNEITGFFKTMYDKVVGKSYVPDMVDDIAHHMKNLDVAMTAPARNATVQTGKTFEGLAFTAQNAMNQVVSVINFSWGSAVQTVSQSLAQMTTKHVEWAQVGIQIGQQFLAAMINQIIQLMAQWALATVFGQAQNAAQLTSHTATESAKTAITATNEAARLGTTLATNKAIMAGTIASLASIAAVGNASMAVMQAVVVAQAAVLAAMGAALAATVVGAPLAPGFFAASATVAAAGSAAVLAGTAAIQTALGTAIAATTAALAIPAFAQGGAVFGPTLALVGERASRSNPEFIGHANQLGLGGPMTIMLEVDGQTFARIMTRYMPGVLRRQAIGA